MQLRPGWSTWHNAARAGIRRGGRTARGWSSRCGSRGHRPGASAACRHAARRARAYLLHGRFQQPGAYPAPLIAGLGQYQRDAPSRIEGCEPHPDKPGLRDQALAELPDAGRQHRPGRRHRRLPQQPHPCPVRPGRERPDPPARAGKPGQPRSAAAGMLMLNDEGLVYTVPQRGTYVAEPSRQATTPGKPLSANGAAAVPSRMRAEPPDTSTTTGCWRYGTRSTPAARRDRGRAGRTKRECEPVAAELVALGRLGRVPAPHRPIASRTRSSSGPQLCECQRLASLPSQVPQMVDMK